LHTLKDLQNDLLTLQSLGPEKRLKMAEGLTVFPRQIFELAESIEILDLSDNALSTLPDDFSRFKNLKILFLSNNYFKSIPEVISECPKLEMISFKSNQLESISEQALPIKTRWLILTNNKISKLPSYIGKLEQLQKLALAGNNLTALPDSMANCKNLELIRLSANNFTEMPRWLFKLPKLAWLAFSGNPCTSNYSPDKTKLTTVQLTDLKLGQQLGQGASGVIYQGKWLEHMDAQAGLTSHENVAVKLFKGSVTSDGYPSDELKCCLTGGNHKNIIKAVAKITHPQQLGLVMELIPPSFVNLGLPPSLKTCTRDTFPEGTEFSISTIESIAQQMISALQSLHENEVSHGDIYAHNIMLNQFDQVLFGDFGAATCFSGLAAHLKQGLITIEMRALGYLLDDLLNNMSVKPMQAKHGVYKRYSRLLGLKDACINGALVPADFI
jgi:serine/threonine protein kinase